jgi:microcystin synthetase protein McyA
MVGLFINTLPMRVPVSPDAFVAEWLKQLRTQWLAMREYEHTPLARIQKWSAIPPGSSLFRSILMFDNHDLNKALREQGGTWVKRSFREYDQTGYPITVTVYNGIELCLQIEFDRALFDPLTITRMLDHLRMLLESMVTGGEKRIADVSMLARPELRQVLAEWNDYRAPYPGDCLLHELFEAQVERTPDRVAVEYEGRHLSYRELNRRANQVAHHLRALGVEPDTLVGVCMNRSLELVVALYGVLKAGGAYVPIDPEYPQERIAYMLQDAGLSVLLSETRLVDQLPVHDRKTICLDDWGKIAGEDTVNPGAATAPMNLAYMIYTSGSTGRPKGAMNTHRGICNRLLWMQDQYCLAEADRVLQKTPFSFDVSVWEFFWPLSVGARLVVTRPGGHRDAAYLVKLIMGRQVTVLHFVPSMLRVFLEEPGVQNCRSLRDVICSGEALPHELQERFFDLLPARLHNLYGPTEAAVDVTHWTCQRHDKRETVPIGRPIANTQVYILNRFMQPVPIGVPGELYIGGVQVGRGYHNHPELTAEKFVPDPFLDGASSRLYKTGDLCRWFPDGTIDYLGRLDHQVKINGCRVELGEIEATLGRHSVVQQCVVTAQEDGTGGKRLVAHVVPNPEYQIDLSQDKLHPEHVRGWQSAFDEMYRQSTDVADTTFNIAGWKSSYTGEPISAQEMRTWVDSTVDRILALRPQDVWEIGCGTGLLLHRLAPHCAYYHATDSSASVVEDLQRQIASPGPAPTKIVVRQASAHDFRDVRAETFDVVILNSVAQYFPSVSYLVQVLEGVVRTVKPGGAILLGDIRSQPLLEAFHGSVQLHQAPSSLPCTELRRRIQTALTQENELAIHPDLFSALRKHLPAISQVEIQLKRGHHRNELTLFRYDVVLQVSGAMVPALNCTQLDWQQCRLTLSDLRHYLVEQQPGALIVTQVFNGRLECELNALQVLASAECPATAGELRESLRADSKSFRGVDPEDLWALGESLGYTVQVRWSKEDAAGSFDVVFLGEVKQAEEGKLNPLFDSEGPANAPKPWSAYGNNPLRSAMVRNLTPELRSHLSESLPDYMMPSAFVFLEKLPLMPNGKLDRRALPLPSTDTALFGGRAVDSIPEIGTEQKIAEIWQEILGITRIGREDNFFDLGGDSLRLTLVRSGLQRAFNKEIALLDLFKFPTVRMLAQQLADKTGGASMPMPDKIEEQAMARKRATRWQGQLRQRLLDESRLYSDEPANRN